MFPAACPARRRRRRCCFWHLSPSHAQVLLLAGPDKGKTGYMIGMEGGSMAATKAIVKLETSSALGMREIKVWHGRVRHVTVLHRMVRHGAVCIEYLWVVF